MSMIIVFSRMFKISQLKCLILDCMCLLLKLKLFNTLNAPSG